MSSAKKTSAALRDLPAEQQRAIAALLQEKTAGAARAELRKEGVETTAAALTEFYSWWCLQEQFKEWTGDVATMLSLLKQQHPYLSEEELSRYGSAVFQLRAIKTQDVKSFSQLVAARHKADLDLRKLELRREALRLQREKFEFDAAKACLAKLPELKAIAASKRLDDRDKIDQIRLRLFGVLAEPSADNNTPAENR